jgi:hypothetical protein
MPLTRHLYELDEVAAALQICIQKGWGRSSFWLWELVRSEESELAHDTLIDAWLRWGGGHDPTLLTAPHNTDQEWCKLRDRVFTACRKAKTLTSERFLNATAEIPEYPTPTSERANRISVSSDRRAAFVACIHATEELTEREATHLWNALEMATRHSRTEAMWLLQAVQPILSIDTIWTLLESLWPTAPPCVRETSSSDPIHQLLHQAAFIMLMCMTAEERIEALVPQAPTAGYDIREWGRWDVNLDRRAARREEIPPAVLHQGTTRGTTPSRYTNIGDVRDPVPLLGEACRWWKKTLASAGITEDAEAGTIIFPDDDVLEAFYARHFPDDIPDEWSAKDQQKSHGRGCAESASAAPSIVLREERLSDNAWIAGIQLNGRV